MFFIFYPGGRKNHEFNLWYISVATPEEIPALWDSNPKSFYEAVLKMLSVTKDIFTKD